MGDVGAHKNIVKGEQLSIYYGDDYFFGNDNFKCVNCGK